MSAGEAGSSWPGADDTFDAATAVAKSAGEARPSRFVEYSVTSESEPEHAESPDGNSSFDKDEQYMQLLRIMEQGSASQMLEKLREFDEAENCQCVDVVFSTSLRGGVKLS